MSALAEAECTSVGLFAALADDREGMRKAIKSLTGLDPATGKTETIEVAKIVAAWKTSNIRADVVVKANAEREANFLPMKVPEKELEMAQLAYEKFEDIELTDEVAPGQAYYEQMVTELSSTLKADRSRWLPPRPMMSYIEVCSTSGQTRFRASSKSRRRTSE